MKLLNPEAERKLVEIVKGERAAMMMVASHSLAYHAEFVARVMKLSDSEMAEVLINLSRTFVDAGKK